MDIALGHSVWIGLAATAAMTLLLYVLPVFGFPKTDVAYFLGTLFRFHPSRASLYGLIIHFAMGIIFAFLYGLGFVFLDVSPKWWVGSIAGVFHWLAMMLSMDMLGEMNRGVQSGQIAKPGFLLSNLGAAAALGSLVRHVSFGTVVGLLFDIYGT